MSMGSDMTNKTPGRFEIGVGDDLSFLAYETDRRQFISLLHTQVPVQLRGRGIASELARMAFAFAESNALKVEVICPVVYHFITKHPEYKTQMRIPSFDGMS
jgi:predicted GNAT family acetyltransferase